MKLAGTIDASPTKRIIHSIIADYTLGLAICEWVDNSIDAWHRNGRKKKLNVWINLDENQQSISIKDNAGGLKKSELHLIVSPGSSISDPKDETIGIFGVGSKRAVIHLSQDVKITSRYRRDKTYMTRFDDTWLEKATDWELLFFEVDDIDEGTTMVELNKLRNPIRSNDILDIKKSLSFIYGKIVKPTEFDLFVNDVIIVGRGFEDWSYPPPYEPTKYCIDMPMDDGSIVMCEILGGLTKSKKNLDADSDDYGVYFYCNNRLISSALKTYEIGFTSGKIGQPHTSLSILRIIVSLRGRAIHMPWNSSKSGINVNHRVFKELQEKIVEMGMFFGKVAKHFSGNWDTEVFKYDTGKVKIVHGRPSESKIKTYLPSIPKNTRQKYSDVVKSKNKSIATIKPWTTGLYEVVIAVEEINKLKLDQKNRIILLLLDSVIEIGFKEFLVNESGTAYSETRLSNIFKNRSDVHTEVKNHTTGKISPADWKKIEYYYLIRCKLVHERASLTVTDEQAEGYRKLTEDVLGKLFGLRF